MAKHMANAAGDLARYSCATPKPGRYLARKSLCNRFEIAPALARNHPKLDPYSRTLRRGAIADSVDGRSALGRFIRDLEAQLIAHVGGSPTITQKLLIERAVKLRVQLDMLDTKLAMGSWTPHDSRTYGGMLNAFRLVCRELGLQAAAVKPASLDEQIALLPRMGPPSA